LVGGQNYFESHLGLDCFAVRCNSSPMCLDRSKDGIRFGVAALCGLGCWRWQRQASAKGGAPSGHAGRLDEKAAP
jgi:hypothetical protein